MPKQPEAKNKNVTNNNNNGSGKNTTTSVLGGIVSKTAEAKEKKKDSFNGTEKLTVQITGTPSIVNNSTELINTVTPNKLDFEGKDSNYSSNENDLVSTTNTGDNGFSNKKKKKFVERVGDWNCFKCRNLNFSFRVVCNRCQLSKVESVKMSEQYKPNLSSNYSNNNYLNPIYQIPMNQLNFVNVLGNNNIYPNNVDPYGCYKQNLFSSPNANYSTNDSNAENIINNGTSSDNSK